MLIGVIFIVLYMIPVCLIAALKIKHIKASNKVVILDAMDFNIAKDYAIISQYFNILEAIFSTIIFVFWVNFGFYALQEIFGRGLINETLYVVLFLIFNSILMLPLSAYKTLVIDKSFGFSKTTIRLYIVDTIKSFVMLVIFSSLISFVLIYFINNFTNWWIFGFILIFLIVVLINLIYPTIIAPLFNKFTPLDDENLKSKIVDMMDSVGFKANGIFVMDASRRDGRLNAYFGGLGKSKRVVLFDTLLSKYDIANLYFESITFNNASIEG